MDEIADNEEGKGWWWWLRFALGPVFFILIWAYGNLSAGPKATAMLAIAAWVAWWWLSEVIHLSITALLPVALLPLTGIASAKDVAANFMEDVLFLFIGGFMLALALEHWHIHKRVSLYILRALGSRPPRILFGIMCATFLISMWISNTATVLMLLPAVFAVIHQVEEHLDDPVQRKKFATALLVGLAYSATIGGMATMVGTPTNAIFYSFYQTHYPDAGDMNFVNWFVIGFPISIILLLACYFILYLLFLRGISVEIEKSYFADAYRQLGKMNTGQKMVMTVFLITIVLWFTREDIDFGSFVMPGWSRLFPVPPRFIQESTVAILMTVLLFVLPVPGEKGKRLMNWKQASKMPFDIIILFGGGFVLSFGFKASGLDKWMAGYLEVFSGVSPFILLVGICAIITVISEFASNVTCIQLMLPILQSLQTVMKVHPLFLLFPATLAASLGFMLPVATAPNTIVYSSRRVRSADMMKAGALVDAAGILIVASGFYLLGKA